MIKRPFLFIFTLILLLLPVRHSLSVDSKLNIKVGAFDNYPVIFKDKDGSAKGLYVDILNEIAKKENINFEYVFGSWQDGLNRIKTGEVDMLTSVGYSEERALFMDYPKNEILTVWGELYVLKSSVIDNILKINGKKVAVMTSDINYKNFKERMMLFNIKCEFLEFNSYDEVFKAVESKEADVGVAGVTFGLMNKERYGLKSTGFSFSPTNLYFTTAKGKNQNLLLTIDKYISQWKSGNNFFLEQEKNKWFYGSGISPTIVIPTWVKNLLLTLGILILLSAVFIILLRKEIKRNIAKISEEKEKIIRANRALQIISETNQAVIYAEDETALFREVCSIIVNTGGYRLAWVGFAENDEEKTVRPIAWAGTEAGYLESAKIVWSDTERGRGPTGTAIRTHEIQIAHNIMKDPRMVPWREAARERGYQSSIVLPFNNHGYQIGALNIYSKDADAFNENEIKILKRLVENMAFGVLSKHVISEHKLLEKELLKASNDRYKAIFVSSRDAIMTIEPPNWKFSSSNPATVEMFKAKSEGDFLSYDPWSLSPKKQPDGSISKDKALEMIEKAMKDGSSFFEWTHRRLDGEIFPTEVLLSKIELDEGTFLLALVRDVTVRKNLEEKVKESAEEKYQNLFENSVLGSSIVSPDGKWLEVNQTLCDLLGYTKEELLKKEYFSLTFPEDMPATKNITEKLLSGEINKGTLEKRYICKNGEILWVFLNIRLFRDESGKPLYFLTITEDITERKKLDQIKSDFLFLASHQLRTPLSTTKWVLESILSDKGLTKAQKNKFSELVVSNERLIHLVNRTLDVSRIEFGNVVVSKKTIDIKKVVKDIVSSLKTLITKNKKRVTITAAKGPVNVFCDPFLINEIIENLIGNAIDYSKKGSTNINVSISKRRNDYLISVHNDGTIDETVLEKGNIFNRFSRGEKASGSNPKGSGLGLYITKKFVEINGGAIWFESNIKSGTTFYFTIVKNKS